MFIIAFRGFGKSKRGKTLWQIVFLSHIWFVWKDNNARIFAIKERYEGEVWDILYLYSSLWASCTNVFRGVPLSFLLLNWVAVCNSPL